MKEPILDRIFNWLNRHELIVGTVVAIIIGIGCVVIALLGCSRNALPPEVVPPTCCICCKEAIP